MALTHSGGQLVTRSGEALPLRMHQVAVSNALFDPLKCEAVKQFLISGNLHAFEKIMPQGLARLVAAGSG
jgi:hypothetical protein